MKARSSSKKKYTVAPLLASIRLKGFNSVFDTNALQARKRIDQKARSTNRGHLHVLRLVHNRLRGDATNSPA